jgi:hypothetical protein
MYSCLTTTAIWPPPPKSGAVEKSGFVIGFGCFDGERLVMAEEKKTGRVRIIGLRLTGDEYGLLEGRRKKSTVGKLSEYVRRVLFGKTITVYNRNQSLDDFMAEMILLRKELNAIGVNFNQAVHRLHTLDYLPQMQRWLEAFERDKERYFEAADAIKLKINSISEVWLQ